MQTGTRINWRIAGLVARKCRTQAKIIASSLPSSLDHAGVRALTRATHTGSPLAIYVHWPFCEALCPYCDFTKQLARNVDQDRMKACLVADLKTQLEDVALVSTHRPVQSVFFGGGTPSLMDPATVETLLTTIRSRGQSGTGNPVPDGQHPHSSDDGIEVTLEANPTSTETQKLRDFRACGITRVSLGLQALEDDALRFLGRKHSAAEGLAAARIALALFPATTSLDLMFGRPSQTPASWAAELKQVVELGVRHVSIYELTVKKGTPLARSVQQGTVSLPNEDTLHELYEFARVYLASHGLAQYEVSNFARPGAESRHNRAYWLGDDYLGIGPGAHARFTMPRLGIRVQRVQIPSANEWMKQVERKGHGTRTHSVLDVAGRLPETLVSALSCRRQRFLHSDSKGDEIRV